MKVKIEIDCTPEEARAFFGLPDLRPVHEAYVDKMSGFIRDGFSGKDAEQMLQGWMQGMGNFADLQKAMFASLSGGKSG